MRYYVVEPEVPGGLGSRTIIGDYDIHPPRVDHLHYEFAGWQGSDLVTSYPVFLVTERLRQELVRVGASGCEFDKVSVTTSSEFRKLREWGALKGLKPGEKLPKFHWLKVTGVAAVHDFGQPPIYGLVVSERVLDILKTLNLGDAEIQGYC